MRFERGGALDFLVAECYDGQRAIPRMTSTQVLCTPTVAQSTEVVTDYAAYASIGVSPEWGGVCRAATTDVVNIMGGGAVVPVIREGVADVLWERLRENGSRS